MAISEALVAAYYLRAEANMSIAPKTIGSFTIVAVAIGCTEKLVFRGWLQSQFRGRWAWAGILFAAFAHAAHKAALFLSPQIMYNLNTMGLADDILAGLFLGYTRYYTGSVWPALIAHGNLNLEASDVLDQILPEAYLMSKFETKFDII